MVDLILGTVLQDRDYHNPHLQMRRTLRELRLLVQGGTAVGVSLALRTNHFSHAMTPIAGPPPTASGMLGCQVPPGPDGWISETRQGAGTEGCVHVYPPSHARDAGFPEGDGMGNKDLKNAIQT